MNNRKNFYFKTVILLTAVSLSTSGCSLDPKAGPDSTQTPAPTTSPNSGTNKTPDPVHPNPSASTRPTPDKEDGPTFELKWNVSETYTKSVVRAINLKEKSNRKFKLEAPITVPWVIPDTVEINITRLPVTFYGQNKSLQATLTAKSQLDGPELSDMALDPTLLTYDMKDEKIKSLHFKVSGLTKHFKSDSDGPEEKLFLKLMLVSPENNLDAAIEFELMTPPSKLVYMEKSIADYETSRHSIPESIKYLNSSSTQLLLIQVIELQDLSDEPIAVDLPTSISGTMWQRSESFYPQYYPIEKTLCMNQTLSFTTDETFSTRFILLPLGDDLEARWKEMMNNETNEIDFEPKESKAFGIYAMPTQAYEKIFKDLLNLRSPREFSKLHPLENVPIATSCSFTCKSVAPSTTFLNQCKSIPDSKANLKKDCEKRVSRCMSLVVAPVPIVVPYNSCFEAETLEGLDTISSYGGIGACPGGWFTLTLKTENALRGTKVGSIYFKIRPEDTFAGARYGYLREEHSGESRDIPILNDQQLPVASE